MQTKAQTAKKAKRQQNISSLLQRYKTDPEFGQNMAQLTGALFLAISVVDLCQQDIDHMTYNILIPARLRKAIKDLSTACDRVIRAQEKNELMTITDETFLHLADDGTEIKKLLIAMTGISWDSFNRVIAYTRNLKSTEEIKNRNNKEYGNQ